jgi:uncharacterized protein with PhoU and TrkA domain
MSAHDKLSKANIVPTIDAERAYRLGQQDARQEIARLQDELDVLKVRLTEISLLASRRIK